MLSMRSSRDSSRARSFRRSVARTAQPRENLPALREVPVAEGVTDRDLRRRPCAAAQHLVTRSEVHLGIFGIREDAEARVRKEVARRPLPHVADHLVAAEVALAARQAA